MAPSTRSPCCKPTISHCCDYLPISCAHIAPCVVAFCPQAVAPVKKITVLQANGPAHVLEPEVSQIVKKLKVKVQDDGTLLQEGEA